MILFIHGFPTSSWDWHSVCPAFAPSHRLISLDMLGFGFSDKPRDYKYSITGQADLIEDLLMHLNVKALAIVAHDYGDSVAQELLARFESRTTAPKFRLNSVCFLNGGLFPETHRPLLIQRLLASPLGAIAGALSSKWLFVRNLKATLGSLHALPDQEFDTLWDLYQVNHGQRVLHKLITYIEERRQYRDRWVAAMQSTRVPLTLAVGEVDPISGRHMAQRYRELIPASQVFSLPRVGHYPQLEAPNQVIAAIQESLQFAAQALT